VTGPAGPVHSARPHRSAGEAAAGSASTSFDFRLKAEATGLEIDSCGFRLQAEDVGLEIDSCGFRLQAEDVKLTLVASAFTDRTGPHRRYAPSMPSGFNRRRDLSMSLPFLRTCR
jgi:hypothetical protein